MRGGFSWRRRIFGDLLPNFRRLSRQKEKKQYSPAIPACYAGYSEQRSGINILNLAREFITCNLRNTQFHVVSSSFFYMYTMSIVVHTAKFQTMLQLRFKTMESYKTDARLREVIVNGRFQLQPGFVVLWEIGRTWCFKDRLKTTTIDNKNKRK